MAWFLEHELQSEYEVKSEANVIQINLEKSIFSHNSKKSTIYRNSACNGKK